MLQLTYTQFFEAVVLAMFVGAAATILLAAATGRIGDPDDDTEG